MRKVKYRRMGSLNEGEALSLIMFIEENEEILVSDLMSLSGNYDRLKRVAESLRDEGLIDIDIADDPRVRITYRLTEKGKKVAEKLKEIEKIVGD